MNSLALTANEKLVDEITKFVMGLVPVDVDEIKNKISSILLKYHVKKVENDEVHPSLTDDIELFLSAKKLEGLSESTLESYKLELRIFSEKVKKHTENIDTPDIRLFLSQFPHLKMSSVSRKLSVLKSFFGWLTAEEIIQRDPTSRIKPPREEKPLPKALTIEELEMLREGSKTSRQRAMLEVIYATGCRLSEIHKLNIEDINQQTMSCIVLGKGNKQREVYFSFRAMYHLNRYLQERDDDCEALFITERRPFRRLSRRGIQREIKKIAENVGLADKVHPHVLRHTFATLLLNNGAELVAIQELLGHSSSDTTLRYASISEDRKREQHKRYLVQ